MKYANKIIIAVKTDVILVHIKFGEHNPLGVLCGRYGMKTLKKLTEGDHFQGRTELYERNLKAQIYFMTSCPTRSLIAVRFSEYGGL